MRSAGPQSTLDSMDAEHPPVVIVDPDVMGGTPCLAGSRLPATTLVACADSDWQRTVQSWPWLTSAHIGAARAWLADPLPHPQPKNWPLEGTAVLSKNTVR